MKDGRMLKQHHNRSYQVFEVDDSVTVIVEVVIVRNTIVIVIVTIVVALLARLRTTGRLDKPNKRPNSQCVKMTSNRTTRKLR